MLKKSAGVLLFASFLLWAVAASAVLLVTDSGVSSGSADNSIGERKSSWDAAQVNDWIVAWMKIPPGSNQENGAVRYRYKVSVTAPDKTAVVEGPFDFPADGIASFNKQVAYYAGLKTSTSPNPCQGEWKIEFTLIDTKDNKEDLGALLPFYLTGSDKAQAPTDINVASQKAVDETVDMSMLAVFNTAKQYGAQQEQARQTAAAAPTATATTIAGSTVVTETTVSSTTTTTIKKAAKKKPAKKKGKKI